METALNERATVKQWEMLISSIQIPEGLLPLAFVGLPELQLRNLR